MAPPPSKPRRGWTRRAFLRGGAVTGGALVLGAHALWPDTLTRHDVVHALTLEFDRWRTRPGHQVTLHAQWRVDMAPPPHALNLVLLRGREGQACRQLSASVAALTLPFTGGRGHVTCTAPMVALDEIDRRHEAFSLTAALAHPGDSQVAALCSPPLDVIVSSMVIGC